MSNNKYVLIALVPLFLGFATQANALDWSRKKKKAKTETLASVKTAYDKLLSEKHLTANGFITIHKIKEKVYFELPLRLLKRDMLLGSTVTSVSDNRNVIVGSKPVPPLHFRFEKLNHMVCLSAVQTDNIQTEADPRLEVAIAQSNIGAILAAFKIAAYNRDSTAVVFEVTDFFAGDNKLLTPFDKYSANLGKGRKRSEVFQSSKSYVDTVKSFGDNLSVRSCLSYTYSISGGKGPAVNDEPFTAMVTRSVILLDSVPYRPRITDSRIAIFPTPKTVYSAREQRTKTIYYANRWRLEPSDPEAYARGEKVKPVKPVTFYIDNGFPEKWRKAIHGAVEQWNEPFEEIGFSNAIRALDFPADDSTFDPDNIKYSCIRYAPIAIQNAMGPSWVDPRSGEILSASVYLYHDAIKLLNNWLFIQTSPADKRVRHTIIPEEIISDGLRYVVSHEVGHCLGFMHNMSASSVIPVDSLRSPSFTQKQGTTTSIMDYARFNYVAQPGDYERGVKLTPPRFGAYDKFLIRWNYTPLPQVNTSEQEYDLTSGWISQLSGNPVYRYGKQQSDILDPRSQTEDLGDDAVKASRYGIKNLQYILSHLNEWVGQEDTDYSYRADIYDGIILQYLTYLMHVYGNIGGVYLHEKHVGDQVEALVSVPREKQKEAVDFLLQQLASLDWMDQPDIMEKLPLMGSPAKVLRGVLMKALIAAPAKVEFSALKAGKDAYTVEQCMYDIYQYIWGPTKVNRKLSSVQISLQSLFVRHLASTAGIRWSKASKALTDEGVLSEWLGKQAEIAYNSFDDCTSDLKKNPALYHLASYDEQMPEYFVPKNQESLCYGYYLRIRDLLRTRINHPDQATRLHYQLLLHQMNNALNR